MTTLSCVSPIDGAVVAEREALTETQAGALLERVRRAQPEWAARPLEDRVTAVREGVARLAGMDDAVEELARMMGRPVRYGGEFGGVTERAYYMCDIAAEALSPLVVESSERFERRIEREPHGVCLVIAPWNYPYMTAINAVAPALIAGNAVMLKPATQTLLTAERMVRAFADCGVPEEIFAPFFGDHATIEALIEARAFDFVSFTGSVAAGRRIERAAAGTFLPLGLELGGKDPGYVRADADLDSAVDGLMDGAMFNAGQCCCGIERIYVHADLFEAFVEKAVAWARALKLGNPLDPETTLGPMAHPRFAEEARVQVAEAVNSGATAHIDRGDFPEDDGGAYLMPQVLTNVTHQMRVMREETFGPVVGIMPVAGDDEAIELMNDSPYGLTAAIYTADSEAASHIGAALDTGTVYMNRCDYLDPALCWTGCKDTGRGAALSVLGFHSVTRPKSYHLRKGE
ncbi:aldehyde dehydrogenase family protein [Dichotomicrobium thermohalophilum]|uniref:Acyl-CoA reductase-like NAD-dependent aldehyde dehydrogenase n=1 Tax=Dichotomicrobium thermohalophilum TaxID=933063 RepID=A0A397PF94_9HYPH|nr:aldehyde dehydrogenase family protein [Dichotomicrobium thermohalophilum]RIA47628.1 acyl-CoA reductase-like NAD-dependent aldehyde dehydrogenase [Dichotomicrobium thermohalophilum]